MRLDCKPALEKLFMVNLHESFTKLKANYTESLSMIEAYITEE